MRAAGVRVVPLFEHEVQLEDRLRQHRRAKAEEAAEGDSRQVRLARNQQLFPEHRHLPDQRHHWVFVLFEKPEGSELRKRVGEW